MAFLCQRLFNPNIYSLRDPWVWQDRVRCPHITGPDLVSRRSRARTEIPMADPMPLAAPPGLSGHDVKQHFLQVSFIQSVQTCCKPEALTNPHKGSPATFVQVTRKLLH